MLASDWLKVAAVVSFAVGLFYWWRANWRQRLDDVDDVTVINAFGAAMERDATPLIYDVKRLPFPKIRINRALLAMLRTENDRKRKEVLKIGLLALAKYQEGVGEPPIDETGLYGRPTPATKAELVAETKMFTNLQNDPRIMECRIRSETEFNEKTKLLKRADEIGIEQAIQEYVVEAERSMARISNT